MIKSKILKFIQILYFKLFSMTKNNTCFEIKIYVVWLIRIQRSLQ